MSVKNMSKTISVDYIWNKELALQTSKLFYDYDMRHSAKRYIGWFFVALVQFGIVGALKHESYGILYLSTFLVFYWYFGRWFLRKRMLLNFYKKNMPQDTQVHFIIDTEGLHKDKKRIPWEEITRIIELENGILVQSLHDTLFFQNSAFGSVDERKEFLALAKDKGKR
ncbi:hypothetical protein MLC52_08820 [Sulfurimonas sp. NW15]|uniref:hypothetical protein n=2 Tax=Sulfurimonadaceae TaxID=2771471 RepID=UPI003DA8970A